ncbi:MAG TPA: mannose-6-phosphate isomerase, class I [Aeromicrobium sp.]|nr:mannose-6-phosphate isomerase, class I [Aeromicrobium sp.]HKY56642.1 mannose-6-phosphate isomerase, class I [Aeromicrobium sp.]
MFRLGAAVQNYDWGSPTAIPEFLGEPAAGEPVAELWFGTHPLGPSLVETSAGPRALADQVGDLPFMLKVLAPAQPLSIQVHPANDLAASGFAAEEAAGIALSDTSRDYKDPHHKPEMVYALTPFETLVGLRPVTEAVQLLSALDVPVAKSLLDRAGDGTLAMVAYVLTTGVDRPAVDEFVEACADQLDAGTDVRRGYLTVVEAARIHPSDPGLVLALLLNRVTLEPGRSAFIGPGLIHAHLSGLCLEVMASSDNVFRAGLTTKRVNAEGVLASLKAADGGDAGIAPTRIGTATELFEPQGGLFALSVTHGSEARLPGAGHRILLCLDGTVDVVSESGDQVTLGQGQAAFASADDGALELSGSGTTAQAYVPGFGNG